MTVAGPWLRELDKRQQVHLLIGFGLLCLGATFGAAIKAGRQRTARIKAGRILVSFPALTRFNAGWNRWLSLLLMMPMLVWVAYAYINMLAEIPNPTAQWFYVAVQVAFVLYYGWIAGDSILLSWVEGCGDTVDLCENGILFDTNYFDWNDTKLKQVHYRKKDSRLSIYYGWRSRDFNVPRNQGIAVKEILNEYRPLPRLDSTNQT